MKTTKLIIALTAIVAIGILATGIVLAQNNAPQTYGYSTNPYNQDQGFWGWLGGCFTGTNQPNYQYQQTPLQPNTDSNLNQQPQNPLSPQQPIQPQNPGYYYPPQSANQGFYSNNYGRGCMGW